MGNYSLLQQKLEFKVGIHCPGCKKKILKALHPIKGVKAVDIDEKKSKVTVEGDDLKEKTVLKKLKEFKGSAEVWKDKDDKNKVGKEKLDQFYKVEQLGCNVVIRANEEQPNKCPVM